MPSRPTPRPRKFADGAGGNPREPAFRPRSVSPRFPGLGCRSPSPYATQGFKDEHTRAQDRVPGHAWRRDRHGGIGGVVPGHRDISQSRVASGSGRVRGVVGAADWRHSGGGCVRGRKRRLAEGPQNTTGAEVWPRRPWDARAAGDGGRVEASRVPSGSSGRSQNFWRPLSPARVPVQYSHFHKPRDHEGQRPGLRGCRNGALHDPIPGSNVGDIDDSWGYTICGRGSD